MSVTPDILQGLPLFSELGEVELVQVMTCFSLKQVAAGEDLYIEGAVATSACFVVEGELDAFTALPGGGETLVGVIRGGEMIGEMALIAGGNRTASVRARTEVTVVSVSFAFFQAALNQMSVPAFKILRRVISSLAGRLEILQDKIIEAWDCGNYRPESFSACDDLNHRNQNNDQVISFQFRPFLAVTPFFENFDEVEVEHILASGQVMEIPRNDYLYREGSATAACFLVVRGAVDNSIMRDRRYQFSVLGPGRLCGANSLINPMPHHCDSRVRSDALVLRITADKFEELLHDSATASLKFQAKISHNQLLELRSADNLLTTLISQAHIRESIGCLGMKN